MPELTTERPLPNAQYQGQKNMSRIDEMIRRIEANEKIDLDRELTLLTLEFAQQGEQYADQMIELIESLDQSQRYSDVESIELFESGGIKKIQFQADGGENL
jgi:hypothetical protein